MPYLLFFLSYISSASLYAFSKSSIIVFMPYLIKFFVIFSCINSFTNLAFSAVAACSACSSAALAASIDSSFACSAL